MPAVTLALPLTALFFRYLYAGLQDAGAQPFATAARARGLTERAIVYRHILPNGVLPTITIIGLAIGSLMSSLVLVEQVFSWPGLGSLLIMSVTNSDYNTVVAIVLLTAATYVVVAAVVDVAYQLDRPEAAASMTAEARCAGPGFARRRLRRVLARIADEPPPLLIGAVLFGLFVIMALIPEVFAPHSPYAIGGIPLTPSSSTYPLGTDQDGRDILSRVIYSARVDVPVSIAARRARGDRRRRDRAGIGLRRRPSWTPPRCAPSTSPWPSRRSCWLCS